MATSRTAATLLSKAIERTTAVVYIIGIDGTIYYANPACSQWIGIESDRIAGTKCIYNSENLTDKMTAKVGGLCLPPDILKDSQFSGDQQNEFVISAVDSNEKRSWRRANAIRLLYEDQPELVLVLASVEVLDAPPTKSPSHKLDSDQLHLALAEIRQHSQLTHRANSLVGISPFASRLRRQAKIAAECRSDLLIVGPTGSGKEHLARTIHSIRSDNQQPGTGVLIPVDCSIADQQMLQTIIGESLAHRKQNRFTKNVSRFDWLLLQNVDALNAAAQGELLGFLQLPEFPLRVVATATQSLVELSSAGRFLSELAHHLSIMAIELVALSCRSEDVPLLAQAILEHENISRKRQFSGFDKATTQLLLEYQWPGNLKQLKHTITAAAAVAQTSQITISDLPKKFHDSIKAQRIGSPTETEIQLESFLANIEKELIVRAIQQAKGNKTKAAKLLGISRAKLLRRTQYFELDFELEIDSASGKSVKDSLEPTVFEELTE